MNIPNDFLYLAGKNVKILLGTHCIAFKNGITEVQELKGCSEGLKKRNWQVITYK